MAVTYQKLKSGEWGVRVEGTVSPGQTVEVRTKAGKVKREVIARVVWSGDGISLCAIGGESREPSGSKPTTATRRAARRGPLASGTFQPRAMREPGAGEQLIHRDTDVYTAGETIHATRIPGGGGPDGCYWTVVAAGKHRISQYEDDCREGEIRYSAIVRPAAEDEWEPVAKRLAEKAAAKEAATAALVVLTTGQGMGREEPQGKLRRLATEPGRPGSYASTSSICADEASQCYHCRPVYDDSPVYTKLTADLPAVEAAIAAAQWKR